MKPTNKPFGFGYKRLRLVDKHKRYAQFGPQLKTGFWEYAFDRKGVMQGAFWRHGGKAEWIRFLLKNNYRKVVKKR